MTIRVNTGKKGYVLFAQPEEDVVVIRVVGRGNFEISPQVKQIADGFNRANYSPQYIIDLDQCPTMDSTFMGALAAIALHQIKCRQSRVIVVNADPVAKTQIGKLGLKYILDLHGKDESQNIELAKGDFHASPEVSQTRFQQMIHMIESHQALIDADSGNEIKFKSVIQTLGESLEQEKEREASE